jgi:hypothetical protein
VGLPYGESEPRADGAEQRGTAGLAKVGVVAGDRADAGVAVADRAACADGAPVTARVKDRGHRGTRCAVAVLVPSGIPGDQNNGWLAGHLEELGGSLVPCGLIPSILGLLVRHSTWSVGLTRMNLWRE